MNGYTTKPSQDDSPQQEMPERQNLRDLVYCEWNYARHWEDETPEALNEITLEQPDLVFPTGALDKDEKFYEYHFNELFIGVQKFAEKVFGGGHHKNFHRIYSPWVAEFPEEFYEYVKAVAHPDPNGQNWEHLLRTQEERMMMISGIVWKVLHKNVLSSLMFGAGDDHERILSSHDKDLMDVEGFARSKLLAETNAAYLQKAPGCMPPHFWKDVGRVSSQIVKMFLPLYNVCGVEFKDKPPLLEEFTQMSFTIVAYAGWLNIVNRLSPGVLNINWSAPGLAASNDEKMILPEVFAKSLTRGLKKDKAANIVVRREKKIKISAAPAITRLSLSDTMPLHHKVYMIQQSHVVYYSAPVNEGKQMALSDYLQLVRGSPRGNPPAWLLFLIIVVFLGLASTFFSSTSRYIQMYRLLHW